MAYIDLQDGYRALGRATIPANLTGIDGQRFNVRRAVRGGGNGVVFEAFRLSSTGGLDRRCAIKLLRRQDPARVDRFHNEARVLKDLGAHARIAPYYDHGEVRLLPGPTAYDVPWIAMELGGTNLRDHLDNSAQPLPPQVLISTAVQMCEALSHIHAAGFIHRDIKPANFVWEENPNANILMIDFGIAKRLKEDVSARPLDHFTRQGEFVGPEFFSSPELIAYSKDQSHPVDHRSDLFQMGKVVWFLATGKISAGVPARRDCPFGGALRDIVLDLLADDPSDRPSDAVEIGARFATVKVP